MKFVFLASLVLAGCCSQALCVGQIKFVLTEAEAAEFEASPSTLRVCVAGECFERDSETVRGGESFAESYVASTRTVTVRNVIEPNADDLADVSLTITRDGTELLRHEWPQTTFDVYVPNGEACGGPVCFAAGPLSSP